MAKKKSGGQSGGRVSQYTDEQQLEFVKQMEGKSGEDKEEACKKFGISIQTYWNWKKKWKSSIGKTVKVAASPPPASASTKEPRESKKPVHYGASEEQIRYVKHKLIEAVMRTDDLSSLKEDVLKIVLDA